MLGKVTATLNTMVDKVLHRNGGTATDDAINVLLEDVEEARKEYRLALKKLENATDPDVIPHLAYEVKTKERRYIHIHNTIKEQGISLSDEIFYRRIIS